MVSSCGFRYSVPVIEERFKDTENQVRTLVADLVEGMWAFRFVVPGCGNEPVLTSLRVQGNFQADSGTPNSLIGFPKPNSTKTLNYYEIMNK